MIVRLVDATSAFCCPSPRNGERAARHLRVATVLLVQILTDDVRRPGAGRGEGLCHAT